MAKRKLSSPASFVEVRLRDPKPKAMELGKVAACSKVDLVRHGQIAGG
jgi:hypothetical protein